MAFIEKKDPVVLNIKLTTKGRELLSTGNLTFKYFAIGDSEIDYGFNAQASLNPFDAKILRPADNNPKIISFIPQTESGDTYNALSTIPTAWYPVTNSVESIGFFTSGSTSFITDSNHVKQPDVMILVTDVTGGTSIRLRKAPLYGRSAEEPKEGDLLLIKWTINSNTTGDTINKTNPTPYLIYRIGATVGTLAADNLTVFLDRNLPDFTGNAVAGIYAGGLVYYNFINFSGNTIFNDFSTDYIDESVLSFFQNSQCPTVVFPFWNMSIIFTEEIAGVQSALLGDKTFGQFDSRAYGGFVSYIQSQQAFYKKLGVIHYTNSSPANVYGEGFYLTTPLLDIPTIMWHKNSTVTLGAKFVSGNGFTLTDLGIHYYDLVDINDPTIVVGKIFDELKMFLIEDQELLFAMSYKSNRSWTLPEFTLGGGGGGCIPTPTPQTLFVQTIIGQPGSIKNTGGQNITGFENVTQYGVEYKLASLPDAPSNWIRLTGGTHLTVNSFTMDIPNTTPDTTYNYRSYVKIGNNEYVDKVSNFSITTLPAPPPPPPPPPPIIPSVQTIIGTQEIGRIGSTGGNSIPTNVFNAVEKYGMVYKQHSEGTWSCSPATLSTGPLAVDNYSSVLSGLAEGVCYDYAAVIQVAGVQYCGLCNSLTTCSSPAPQIFVPTVTTGILWKQLIKESSVDVLTKLNLVTDNGGAPIIEYGLLYSQNSSDNDPAKLVYGGAGISKVSIVADIAENLSFTMTMPDLYNSSPIVFRLFATNSAGIGYGEIVEGTTNPLAPPPPAGTTLFICGATELGANPTVRSCMCAHLGVSVPLQAGQSITLFFADNAYSQANSILTHPINACSWICVSPSATRCELASSSVGSGSNPNPNPSSQECFGSIRIDNTNIDNIVLYAVAGRTPADDEADIINYACVRLSSITNAGGNYTIGAGSELVANNIGGSGSSGGGLIAF